MYQATKAYPPMSLAKLAVGTAHRPASKLPPDILHLIFEILQDGPGCLPPMRLVSPQFYAIITGIMFRTVALSDAMVQEFALKPHQASWSTNQHHLSDYAQHIYVKRALHWESLTIPLVSSKNLKDITWSYWCQDQLSSEYHSIDAAITRISDILPNIRLHIEGLDATSLNKGRIATLPAHQLASLKIVYWNASPQNLKALKMMILSRAGLKTLHLEGGKIPILEETDIMDNERLSPIQKLVIRTMAWQFSPRKAASFFDWKCITHLELFEIDIGRFLFSVPPESLTQVRTLVMRDGCKNPNVHKTIDLLCNLLNKISGLVRLDLEARFNMDRILFAIHSHGPTLRCLRLRGHKDQAKTKWHELSTNCLKAVGISCPNLMQLGIDVNIGSYPIIMALAGFRNLRRLAVFCKTAFRVPLKIDNVFKRDYMTKPENIFKLDHNSYRLVDVTAGAWLASVRSAKVGAVFECVGINVIYDRATSDDDDGPTVLESRSVRFQSSSTFGHLLKDEAVF